MCLRCQPHLLMNDLKCQQMRHVQSNQQQTASCHSRLIALIEGVQVTSESSLIVLRAACENLGFSRGGWKQEAVLEEAMQQCAEPATSCGPAG